MKITQKHAVILSLVLYALACVTPAVEFQSYTIEHGQKIMGQNISWYGWTCLYKGLMAIFVGQFAQFANIFYVVGLMMLQEKSFITAGLCSLFALLSGLHTLLLGKMNIYNDDAGLVKLMYLNPQIGFYLWMASFAVLLVLSVVLTVNDWKSKKGLKEEKIQSSES